MLQEFLNRIMVAVIAIDAVALGVLIIFLVNFRLNIKRRVVEREFALRFLAALRKSDTTDQVASQVGLPVSDVVQYCRIQGLETPEEHRNRLDASKRRKEEENRRILEEEAAWRREQERLAEERQHQQEIETKKRRERLKKFGMA